MEISKMKEVAKNIRRNIVELVYHPQSGHPGGSLSIADIMTVLYFDEMNVSISDMKMPNRDRLVLSKGHAAPALYATLMEKGFIDKCLVTEFRKFGSILQGHPDLKKHSSIEMSTGSLGQGISAAVGMALSSKKFGPEFRVYAILGDGEMQEGQCYEAFMAASQYKLDNLVAIIDKNGLQIDGNVDEIMSLLSVTDKLKSFGWNTIEIDGHDYEQIKNAFKKARETKGFPTAIIANTIKGKGVSFMENDASWHGKAPNKEEFEIAMKELI